MSLLGWLFSSKRSSRFTPLEEQLLAELGSALPDAARLLLDQQIKDITLVQRLADGKEVNCYPMRNGAVRHNPVTRFVNESRDLKFAVVRFRPQQGPTVKAEFFAVDGYFFSILFSESPKQVAPPISISSVKILADPMQPQPEEEERQVAPIQFDGWLGEREHPLGIVRAYVPLDDQARARRLAELEATFPPDYLDLLQRTDGLDLENCAVHGTRQIREFAGDDGNYYLIGEIGGEGMLAVREHSRDGAVFYLAFDGTQRRYGTLRDAIELLCRPSGVDNAARPE